MLNFAHFNCNSVQNDYNKNALEVFMKHENIDIICLAETWSSKIKKCKLTGFNVVEKVRPNGYGGVAIALANNIKFKRIPYSGKGEVVIVRTLNIKKNFVIISVYYPPSFKAKEFEKDIHNLLSQFTNEDTIFCGDFNALHSQWGNSRNDTKGNVLFNLINNSDFQLLNNANFTFHKYLPEKHKHGSSLDLAMINFDDSNLNWSVYETGVGGSHHLPCIIKIDGLNTYINNKTTICAKERLFEAVKKLPLSNNIEEIQGALKSEIQNASVQINQGKFTPKAWWVNELNIPYRELREAQLRYNRDPTIKNLIDFKKNKAIFNKKSRSAKRKSWEDMIDDLNKTEDLGAFWRQMNILNKHEDKQTVRTWSKTENENFLNHISRNVSGNSSSSINNTSPFRKSKDFTLDELYKFLITKSKKSAAGTDGITYAMIKAIPENTAPKLLEAINNCFQQCKIIDAWREIKIIPIPKKNRDLSLIESFRPISLIPIMLKCVNGMTKNRIEKFVENNDILPKRSYAYRKQRSTTMCVNDILQVIAQNKISNRKTVILTMDLDAAYDFVDIEILSDKLKNYGMPEHESRWIIEFLKERKLVLGKETKTVYEGLPQGSCLSPILFNIFTAELHEIEDSNTSFFQYADDYVIVTNDTSIEKAIERIELKAQQFIDKAAQLGVKVNTAKTVAMVIGNKSKTKTHYVQVSGQKLACVDKLVYLGRTITCNLSTTLHYDKCRKDLGHAINLLKKISYKKKGGLHPRRALNTHRALIRSKLEYARSSTYNTSVSVEKNVGVMSNNSLRICLGVTDNTPVQCLYALAGELPPKFRALMMAGKELVKIFYYGLPLKKLLLNTRIVTTGYDEALAVFRNLICKVVGFKNTPFAENISFGSNPLSSAGCNKNNLPHENIRSLFAEVISNLRSSGYQLYATDASIMQSSTGIACIEIKTDDNHIQTSLQIGRCLSSFEAELIGLKTAVESAVSKNQQNIAILTDSLSSIEAIKNKNLNPIIRDFNIAAAKLEQVILQWIPSHTGINYNELADTAAKEAASSGLIIDPEATIEEAFKTIEHEVWDLWQREYEDVSRLSESGSFFRRIFPDVNRIPWFHGKKLNSSEVKLLNRLFTNMSYCKSNLFHFKKAESNLCDFCQVKEDNNHIVLVCPVFDSIRNNFAFNGKYNNLEEILKLNDVKVFKQIVEFLKLAKVSI